MNLNCLKNNFFYFKKERALEFIDFDSQKKYRYSNGIKLQKLIYKNIKKFNDGKYIYLIRPYLIFFTIAITSTLSVFASTNINLDKKIEQEKISSSSLSQPVYKLGPGDRLIARVFKLDKFNAEVTVLPDGTINLPRIGSINVLNLTVNQAKDKITDSYSQILRRPIVYVDLIYARPIKISITGEVNRPGIYSIGIEGTNTLTNNFGNNDTKISTSGWPTIVDAIQRSGGITANGDLRNIILIRKSKEDSQNIEIKVNYWNTLKNGTPIKNYFIYDGDSVIVKAASTREINESDIIASSSFSPSTITVNIVGEVKNPGIHNLISNSPIMQSISAAGGYTANSNKKKITLLRLNNNGTLIQKHYSYNPTLTSNQESNPPLRNGDTIIIEKDSWAKGTSQLKRLAEPIGPIVNALSIYKLLGN